MSQLPNELQTYESICGTTKGRGEANIAEGSSAKSKMKKRGSSGKGSGQARRPK